MDVGTIITAVTTTAGVFGGFIGGKKMGSGQAVSIAVDTVELLQVQVSDLVSKNASKENEITDLRARVDILEDMVTQRAEVEIVNQKVDGVRGVVDRIADKVGA